MLDQIQYFFYPYFFLKNFSVASPKPAVENNSFNSFVNTVLFPGWLFINDNRDSCAFFYSEEAHHAMLILFLTTIKTRSIVKRMRLIASLQFEMVKYNYLLIGKKKRKLSSSVATASSSASLSKRKGVMSL